LPSTQSQGGSDRKSLNGRYQGHTQRIIGFFCVGLASTSEGKQSESSVSDSEGLLLLEEEGRLVGLCSTVSSLGESVLCWDLPDLCCAGTNA
jgi:hypothetical protein